MELKQARLNRKLTQEQLEALSGVHQSVISRLEASKSSARVETLRKLEAALKMKRGTLDFAAELAANDQQVA